MLTTRQRKWLHHAAVYVCVGLTNFASWIHSRGRLVILKCCCCRCAASILCPRPLNLALESTVQGVRPVSSGLGSLFAPEEDNDEVDPLVYVKPKDPLSAKPQTSSSLNKVRRCAEHSRGSNAVLRSRRAYFSCIVSLTYTHAHCAWICGLFFLAEASNCCSSCCKARGDARACTRPCACSGSRLLCARVHLRDHGARPVLLQPLHPGL